MKILHILAQLPVKTGSGVYFTNVIDGLKKYRDIEQACVYATTADYDINILDRKNQFEVVFESENLPFSIVGMSDIMPYPNTLYHNMTDEIFGQWKKEFLKQLNLAKNNFNPDVILTHHLWILSSMAREVFPDKKVVAVCHNTDIRQARQNENLKKKHIHSLKDVDNVLALSNRQFKDIEEVFGISEEKIIDIGAGYNEKIFYPPEHYPEKEKVELVYAGKFDDSKGFYELIKAFRKIEENDDSVTIDLIGNITEQNKERIKKEVGNSKNINVYNAVSQKELADIMRTKDIFILPSYFEGLGLIAVEALGSGLRVVATKIDGLIELLGKELNVDEIIEYVDMPTIYDTDKAVEEEKPAFVLRLADKIENMIKRTREKREIDKVLIEKIQKKSWKTKIEDIKDVLCKDNNSCRQTNMKKDINK